MITLSTDPPIVPQKAHSGKMMLLNLPKKRHMMKTRVGCVRTTTYSLPNDNEHEYGYRPPQDIEGSGDIISNWVTANPSIGKESNLSYVHNNVLAVKHGCTSAADMRKYAFAHPHIRMKEVLPHVGNGGNCSHEGPFGQKTIFAEETMGSVLQADYTDFGTEDSDYPDTTNIMKLSSFPLPVATKASIALSKFRIDEKDKSEAITSHFCMKKFQNIKPKISLKSLTQSNSTRELRASSAGRNVMGGPAISREGL